MLKVFNSLSRNLESIPKQNSISIYSCGPTVYDHAHIGNMRTFLFEDLLIRTLKSLDYKVLQIRNITDIDDKIIQKVQEKKINLAELTNKYTEDFLADLVTLKFDLSSTKHIKATDYIDHMIKLIALLIENNFAYEKTDGVYFAITKFEKYGDFSGLNLVDIQHNISSKNTDFSKDDFGDFVLWKKHKASDGEIYWDSPWGKGRPGWHTECASILESFFPNGVDLHTGGIDLLFPHHTNEKAHFECLKNKPIARMFIHSTHLLVDNKKMSKTSGNFYTIRDLQKMGFKPETIRFYLQTASHYRSPFNFTLEGLEGIQNALKRINNYIQDIEQAPKNTSLPKYGLKKKFYSQLLQDMNICAAIAELFSLINEHYAGNRFDTSEIIKDLKSINSLLQIFLFEGDSTIPRKIETLLHLRNKARLEKDWAESDKLRLEIQNLGFDVKDSKKGSTISKI